MLPPLLRDLDSSETGLLDWPRERVSRSMLEEIAANENVIETDWVDEELHLAALDAALSEGASTEPFPWHPLEVLELERWINLYRERDHIKRLLACAFTSSRPKPRKPTGSVD